MPDAILVLPASPDAYAAAWESTAGPSGWGYGQRLFQAARFVTEMEYQHLVFEEFARKVQPMINAFGEGGTGYETVTNAAIAVRFDIGAGTVEKHISTIFSKLGLFDDQQEHRRVLAVLAWLRV